MNKPIYSSFGPVWGQQQDKLLAVSSACVLECHLACVSNVPIPVEWRFCSKEVKIRGHGLKRVAFYFLRVKKMSLSALAFRKKDNSVWAAHPWLGSLWIMDFLKDRKWGEILHSPNWFYLAQFEVHLLILMSGTGAQGGRGSLSVGLLTISPWLYAIPGSEGFVVSVFVGSFLWFLLPRLLEHRLPVMSWCGGKLEPWSHTSHSLLRLVRGTWGVQTTRGPVWAVGCFGGGRHKWKISEDGKHEQWLRNAANQHPDAGACVIATKCTCLNAQQAGAKGSVPVWLCHSHTSTCPCL